MNKGKSKNRERESTGSHGPEVAEEVLKELKAEKTKKATELRLAKSKNRIVEERK